MLFVECVLNKTIMQVTVCVSVFEWTSRDERERERERLGFVSGV